MRKSTHNCGLLDLDWIKYSAVNIVVIAVVMNSCTGLLDVTMLMTDFGMSYFLNDCTAFGLININE